MDVISVLQQMLRSGIFPHDDVDPAGWRRRLGSDATGGAVQGDEGLEIDYKVGRADYFHAQRPQVHRHAFGVSGRGTGRHAA